MQRSNLNITRRRCYRSHYTTRSKNLRSHIWFFCSIYTILREFFQSIWLYHFGSIQLFEVWSVISHLPRIEKTLYVIIRKFHWIEFVLVTVKDRATIEFAEFFHVFSHIIAWKRCQAILDWLKSNKMQLFVCIPYTIPRVPASSI